MKMDTLVLIGPKLAAFLSSPLSGTFGAAVAVTTGYLAATDLFSGKVPLARSQNTGKESEYARREALRGQVLYLCVAQLIVGVIGVGLVVWLYVLDEIKKTGNPPTSAPTATQTLGLIGLLLLTVIAIGLQWRRVYVSSKMDKVK